MKTMRFFSSLCLISLAFVMVSPSEAALKRGKSQRKVNRLESYGVKTYQELNDQALWHFHQGEFKEAKQRFQAILANQKDDPTQQKTLVYLASCDFKLGEPNKALSSIRKFGKDHADSPYITNMVELAFEIGKGYTLREKQEFKALFSTTKAVRAFEFVNTHDPYSIEAAEALMTMAVLNMQKRNWGEAISQLQDIHRKQPATDISSRAEVILGECYLGYNKGSSYDRKNLILAERYLKGYLDHNPKGKERPYAEELLNRTYYRIGRGELDIARYYLTARKWESSKFVLDQILGDSKLKQHHKEAQDLVEYVTKKI